VASGIAFSAEVFDFILCPFFVPPLELASSLIAAAKWSLLPPDLDFFPAEAQISSGRRGFIKARFRKAKPSWPFAPFWTFVLNPAHSKYDSALEFRPQAVVPYFGLEYNWPKNYGQN
jgi:hypothetical protein